MPPRALLLVDLQNDFCAGGALAVPEGDSTVDVANRLIDWCQSRGEAVIASQDWHPANHGSFAIVRLPIVPRVNPHTVDESATFILFRLFSRLGGGRVGTLFGS